MLNSQLKLSIFPRVVAQSNDPRTTYQDQTKGDETDRCHDMIVVVRVKIAHSRTVSKRLVQKQNV